MWYIVRLDSSRVATLVKVRSGTLVSSGDPTRVKSNYIPVYTTILRQIERCPCGKLYNILHTVAVTSIKKGGGVNMFNRLKRDMYIAICVLLWVTGGGGGGCNIICAPVLGSV